MELDEKWRGHQGYYNSDPSWGEHDCTKCHSDPSIQELSRHLPQNHKCWRPMAPRVKRLWTSCTFLTLLFGLDGYMFGQNQVSLLRGHIWYNQQSHKSGSYQYL